MLTRRSLFGRVFGAVATAIAAPWFSKAATPALSLRPGAFELAMRILADQHITLTPYTGTAMLWSDGQWFIVDFDAPHATSDRS